MYVESKESDIRIHSMQIKVVAILSMSMKFLQKMEIQTETQKIAVRLGKITKRVLHGIICNRNWRKEIKRTYFRSIIENVAICMGNVAAI